VVLDRYELVVVGEAASTADLVQAGARLEARVTRRGFVGVRHQIKADRVILTVEKTGLGPVSTALFAPGALQLHRVQVRESEGLDRTLRQAAKAGSLDENSPPESLWALLREKNLLTEDRLAFFSKTEDGRASMVVVQSVPFLREDLFSGATVTGLGADCQVVAQWTPRLSSVISDKRVSGEGKQVALLYDGALLAFRKGKTLQTEKHELVLSSDLKIDAGRDGCENMAAVLAFGPLPVTFQVKERRSRQSPP
jgi:hypothetical protein